MTYRWFAKRGGRKKLGRPAPYESAQTHATLFLHLPDNIEFLHALCETACMFARRSSGCIFPQKAKHREAHRVDRLLVLLGKMHLQETPWLPTRCPRFARRNTMLPPQL